MHLPNLCGVPKEPNLGHTVVRRVHPLVAVSIVVSQQAQVLVGPGQLKTARVRSHFANSPSIRRSRTLLTSVGPRSF